MAKKKLFANETELAAALTTWLQSDGWDVYHEVVIPHVSSRPDIVARRGAFTWVIETKMNLSLDLMEQGVEWIPRGVANMVSIAVPKNNHRSRWFCSRTLRHFGVGMLEVSPTFVTVNEKPIIQRRLIRKIELRDEQSATNTEYAAAGSARGGFWTPFRGTVDQMRRALTLNGPMTMAHLIDSIQHHYSSAASARGALMGRIQDGTIKGIETFKKEGDRAVWARVKGTA